MGRNLEITDKLQTYIDNFSQSLHPVQQEIISYNNTYSVYYNSYFNFAHNLYLFIGKINKNLK